MTAFRNFIGGVWQDAVGGGTFERRNPADGSDLVGLFPLSGPADAELALDGLDAGWRAWAATNPEKRVEILNKAADIILTRADDLGRELTREEGKTLSAGVMEWKRAAANLRLYSGEALRQTGGFPAKNG